MASKEEHLVESLSSPHHRLQVKNFIWSSDEWPELKHDDFSDEEDVPVIHLGRKDDEGYVEECRKMVAAAQKWGFFKLVDHGVAAQTINDIKVCLNKFFDLEMEQKLKGSRIGSLPLGYSASNADYLQNLPWAEILQLLQSPQQVVEFSQRVYGDDHHHHQFSDPMIKYMNAMEQVGNDVLEMLANGLGLATNFFTRHLTERENTMIRANRYPPCPLPHRCLGLGSHSDPHTLTILLQDQVGGLQVRNDEDDRWFGIRPLPNSFVVNIGDTLEAWTNGRLKSVVHRAVVNEEKYRLSIAYFMSPATSTIIESPPQLVGAEPRKYTTFTWGDFRNQLLKQKRVVGKTALHRYTIYRP